MVSPLALAASTHTLSAVIGPVGMVKVVSEFKLGL